MTVREVARLVRVSPDKIRAWITRGELRAVNTSATRCGRPRYIVLPHHLDELLRARQAVTAPAPRRTRRRPAAIDYYQD